MRRLRLRVDKRPAPKHRANERQSWEANPVLSNSDQAELFSKLIAAPLCYQISDSRAESTFPYSRQKVPKIWYMSEAWIALQLNHMGCAAYTILFPRSLKQSPGIIFSLSVNWAVDKKGQEYWRLIKLFSTCCCYLWGLSGNGSTISSISQLYTLAAICHMEMFLSLTHQIILK